MAQAATVFQKQDLKEMIISLYEFSGIPVPPEVKNNPMNDSVAEVFRQILVETEKCSSRFKLIPVPPKGPASIAWVITHIGKIAFNKLLQEEKIAFTCVRKILYDYNISLRMTFMGL